MHKLVSSALKQREDRFTPENYSILRDVELKGPKVATFSTLEIPGSRFAHKHERCLNHAIRERHSQIRLTASTVLGRIELRGTLLVFINVASSP